LEFADFVELVGKFWLELEDLVMKFFILMDEIANALLQLAYLQMGQASTAGEDRHSLAA
jgi:hypothetical protein